MKIMSSYAVEIKHVNKLFRQTIRIYNDAISYCINKLDPHWNDIKPLNKLERIPYVEKLLHNTSTNKAIYDFDSRFPKMPSYLRRSAIQESIGALSSYHTRLEQWELDSDGKNPPYLQKHLNLLPVFYKGNMYKDELSSNKAKLKVFVNEDWNWVTVYLKQTDIKYAQKHCTGKMKVPVLEHKNKKWFLRFAFDETVNLNKTKLEDQRILAVDLGINTDATRSIMTKSGAILGRKFINFSSDKDLINHALNKIKKIQQKYGSHNTKRLWRYVTFHNEELSRKIAKSITDYAISNNCDVIVFEYLDMHGRKRGPKKQRLHLWRKNTIQKLVEHKVHRNSIHIARICAWNTSKLVYDGSGTVSRHKDNYSICDFSNGKQYNCDLSASYNIGARYFIKEISKSMSAKRWSRIVAKVPECEKRTNCTYSTLLKVNSVL